MRAAIAPTLHIYKRGEKYKRGENLPATFRAFDVLFVRPRRVGKGLLKLIC